MSEFLLLLQPLGAPAKEDEAPGGASVAQAAPPSNAAAAAEVDKGATKGNGLQLGSVVVTIAAHA